MKHSRLITSILLLIFLSAQFIGLFVVYNYIDQDKTAESGKIEFKDLPIGERPPINEQYSYLPIMIAIIVGTIILLVLLRYRLNFIWKAWFLLAVLISLWVAFTAFMPSLYAFLIAAFIGSWKIFRPNVWIQNGTELFIYGGLAAIFVPILNIFSVSILLILIAAYDAYAVWKSKHMITLAKSQSKAKVFAGLLIPYSLKNLESAKKKIDNIKEAQKKVLKEKNWLEADKNISLKSKLKKLFQKNESAKLSLTNKQKNSLKSIKLRTAVLGGGDIGFPLIFAGVVLKEIGLWQSLIIPLFAALGLGLLLYYSKEKHFYPAMPFIGAGCFIGLGIVWLLQMF